MRLMIVVGGETVGEKAVKYYALNAPRFEHESDELQILISVTYLSCPSRLSALPPDQVSVPHAVRVF